MLDDVPPPQLADSSSGGYPFLAAAMSSFAARVEVFRSFADLPADANAFLEHCAGDELCLSGSWFALLSRYGLPDGHTPRIYIVRITADDVIDGILFAMADSRAGSTRKLSSLTSFYTMSFAPLLRGGLVERQRALDVLASYVATEKPRWAVIELRSFVDENPTTVQFMRALRRAGLMVATYAQFENWFFPTGGVSAEEYFKSRPSQVRNTITRKLKKAKKEHVLDFRVCRSTDDLATALADYEKIYARSWKDPEAYSEFIPQLLRRYAGQGDLRLGVLRIDGDAAAAQIWLVTGNRATIYKLAYDEKYAALSVGSILTKMMFDHVLDTDRVTEVDYGIGSEPYKLDWMSECRHIVGILAFNPRSPMGLLAGARHFAGSMRRLGKRARTVPGGSRIKIPESAEGGRGEIH